MSVLSSISGVLTVFVLIILGVLLAKSGIVDDNIYGFLTKLCMKVTVPALLFGNAVNYITYDFFGKMGFFIFIPFLSIMAVFLLGSAVASISKIERKNRGLFTIMFSCSNSIFIGMPVIMAIFGDSSIPFIISYYIGNTVVFWMLAGIVMPSDVGIKAGLNLKTVKNIFSPPLLAFIVGVLLNLSGIKMPDFIMKAVGYTGEMTVPVAMILIGTVVYNMGWSAFKIKKEGWLTLFGRFFISPIICFAICYFAKAPLLITGVFTVSSALPTMNQSMIVAKHYGANDKLAAQTLALTSVFSVVMIPVFVYLMSRFYS